LPTPDALRSIADSSPILKVSESAEISPETRIAIESLHTAVPGALIYTSPRFIRFLEQTLDRRATWLLAHRGDELVGAAPYFEVSSPVGSVMSSLPFFGSNGFPVGSSPAAVEALLGQLRGRANSIPDLISWVVIGNPFVEVSTRAERLLGPPADTRIGQFSDLTRENLESGFDSSRRRNIQKATALGPDISVEMGAKALKFLVDSHAEGMREIGGRAKPPVVFENLVDCLASSEVRLATARFDGTRVAALLTLRFGQTVEYFTPTVLKEYRDTQVLSLLIYQEMLAAQEDGFSVWNWGGTWHSQQGVYEFKKRWGAEELTYSYFIHEGPNSAAAPKDFQSIHHHFPYCYVRPLVEGRG
jgi:hypothetical protein